ncbi:MAG TPA: sugar ABC transporter ATP-binding protein [Vicinamibacterales bacterium]
MAGLEFIDIHKSFGAVHALRGVSLSVRTGETHALMGENGAGKSTLLKILAGIVAPDSGEIRWEDRKLSLSGPREALVHGIGMVYQEMLTFPNLTVAGNIFAGRELTGRGGVLLEREMRARTRALLDRLHLALPPDARMEHLSAAHSQLVQVARALAFECRVLVLDEPTTALTSAESDHLFRVLDDLRGRGVTILYVSHRIPEVFRLCDRMTVLRDGQYVGTFAHDRGPLLAARVPQSVDLGARNADSGPRAAGSDGIATPAAIVRAMVGRDLPPRSARALPAKLPPVLRVRGLTRPPLVDGIDLDASPGEIVGLFGLVGSGRSELLETIFGLYRARGGTIAVGGATLAGGSVIEATRAGIALVPEDRQRQALLYNLTLRHNLVLPRATMSRRVIVNPPEERAFSGGLLSTWRIKAAGIHATPDSLSGGNQQKVVLARWLAIDPRVFLLDEPTKGVDVGAKDEIHDIIRRKALDGAACLVVSSDLPEILAIAHRVVVMREGRVQGELPADQADEESVMRLATAPVRRAS